MSTKPAVALAAAFLCLASAPPAFGQGKEAPAGGAPVGVEAYPEKTEDIYALIDAAGAQADNDGADVVVVLDRTNTLVEDSGLGHVTRRQVFKVLSEKGAWQLESAKDANAESTASLRFNWDPASNFLALKKAVIYRDGKVLTTLGPDSLIDVPQPQHMIYWGARMKLLAIPRLEVGDALEVVTYEKGFRIAYLGDAPDDDERYTPPMRGHFYAVPLFGTHPFPALEQRYTVTVPKNKPLQYQVVNGELRSKVTIDGDKLTYSFWKDDLPAYSGERFSPDASDILPKVVMATVPDWEAKSRWFYEVNDKQFEANDAIRAKVQEIIKGKSENEAIAALLHWVAQEIRYSGISMGKGEGYTLHPGTMTFRDRAGVCKDIAGMLVTMLRAAGYTVYPAMTMAGARVEKTPADQFNHCVVALKQKDGSFRMLDPTWAPFSANTWSNAEREQHFVIGTPEGDTLRVIPALPADANELAIDADTALAENGTLSGSLTFGGHGYLETRLRRHVAYHPASELAYQLRTFLEVLSPYVKLTDFGMTDFRDLTKPFAIRMKFETPDYAVAEGGLLVLHMPLAQNLGRQGRLGRFLAVAESDKRKTDILIWATDTRDYRERLKIPRGYQLVGGPIREKVVSDAADFEATLEQKGNTLVLTEHIQVHKRQIPAKSYPGYKKVMDAVQAFGSRAIYLEKKPAARAGRGGGR